MSSIFRPDALGVKLNPMEELGSLSGTMVAQNKDAATPPIETEMDSAGNWTVKGKNPDDLKQALDHIRFAQQAQVGALQEDMRRMQSQEEAIRKNPIANILTTLAAQMGQAKDMPGWVQAAGRTSQALNPTPEMLRMQRMGVQEQIGQGLQQQASVMERQMAHQQTLKAREDQIASADAAKKAVILEKKQAAILKPLGEAAKQGGVVSEEKIRETLSKSGLFTQDEVEAHATGLNIAAAAGKAMKEETATNKHLDKLAEQDNDFAHKLELFKQKRGADLEKLTVKFNYDVAKKAADIQKTNPKINATMAKRHAEIEEASTMIDKIAANVDANPDHYGPWWMGMKGATTRFKANFSEALSDEVSTVDHATPIMIKLLGEGARGYAQNQREWLEKKTPKLTDTPERLRGKLMFIKSFLEASRKGEADAVAFLKQDPDFKYNGKAPVATPVPDGKQKAGVTAKGVKYEFVGD